MVKFLKRLWKNTRRIIIGVAALVITGFVLLFAGGFFVFLGNALMMSMTALGNLCLKYKVVSALILAILGYTAAELFEAFYLTQKKKRIERELMEERNSK